MGEGKRANTPLAAESTPLATDGVPCGGISVLLDTNVWLDHFIDRSATHDLANSIVMRCIRNDHRILAAAPSTKDCFFLVAQELKRIERSQHGCVSESAAKAINEVAWSCVLSMRKLAYIVPLDDSDVVEAAILRSSHFDYEDNLIIAAAERGRADYLVTSDKVLLAHAPVACISPVRALEIL